MNVHLELIGTTIALDLTQDRVREFRRELTRARREPASNGLPGLLAPEVAITVQERGRSKRYDLYGNSLLCDAATGKVLQFYFGYVLIIWLMQVQ